MKKRLVLLEHAIQRIKHGDEQGLRTQLKTTQVLEIIADPGRYVPYRGKVRDGRVFYSSVDKKCLVAWIEDSPTHHKVHSIENHHHLIPIPVLLLAEQKVLGTIGFLRRFTKPPTDSVTDVTCWIDSPERTMILSGYLDSGVSWWRSIINVRRLLGFIQHHDLDGTGSLVLSGQMWHGRKNRYVVWNQRLPTTLPQALYQAHKQPGTTPDFASVTATILQKSTEKGGNDGR